MKTLLVLLAALILIGVSAASEIAALLAKLAPLIQSFGGAR